MRIFSGSALFVLAGLALGGVTVIACGGDDDPAPPASITPDSGTTTPGSNDDDDKVDSGTTPPAADAGAEAGPDAGGAKALGAACTAASDTSAECESGVCATFGGGGDGEPARNLCTRKCDARGLNAPKCQGAPALSGNCNGKLYCALK